MEVRENFHTATLQALSELVAATGLGQVIEDSGHWIMEEQPEQPVTIIHSFSRANERGGWVESPGGV
jgi:hypothetical protein